MVKGLHFFVEHFKPYREQYILIGGAACEIILEQIAAPFRATHDLDIVLCAETLNSDFGNAFWAFIKSGDYQILERADSKRIFYRFARPRKADFPEMIEIFSRREQLTNSPFAQRLRPIVFTEDVSSLSAILLDDDYYHFITANRVEISEVPLVTPAGLIMLKIKAFIDLTARKNRGEKIDSKDIKKHRNDVLRLMPALPIGERVLLPELLFNDFTEFINVLTNDDLPLKNLGITATRTVIIDELRKTFVTTG